MCDGERSEISLTVLSSGHPIRSCWHDPGASCCWPRDEDANEVVYFKPKLCGRMGATGGAAASLQAFFLTVCNQCVANTSKLDE